MTYYKDKDGNIWEFDHNKLNGIHYKANATLGFLDEIYIPAVDSTVELQYNPTSYNGWSLTPMTKAEAFIEIL